MAFFQLVACCVIICFFNSLVLIDSINFNATVSLNGSGDFNSINDAIAAAPNHSNTRFYIHVSPGTYNERLEIPSAKKFIALIGDNAFTTIIVDNRSNGTGFKTNNSATLSKLFLSNFFCYGLSLIPHYSHTHVFEDLKVSV